MEDLVERFLDALRHERRSSLNTIRSYSFDLRGFERYVTRYGLDLQTVDQKIVRRYIGYLSTLGLGPRTISRHISSLRSFYKYLVRKGDVVLDPAAAISYPKTPSRLPRILSENAIELLVKAALEAERPSTRDIAIIELLYGCGLRVSELVALDLKDLDLPSSVVRVLGKGSKERLVPLTEVAICAVESYLAKARTQGVRPEIARPVEQALFLNRTGTRLSTQGVRRLLAKYSTLSGSQRKINPHLLRHCFATHFLEHGADLRIVQEVLGHADLSSTQVYTQLTKKKVQEIYRKSHPRA